MNTAEKMTAALEAVLLFHSAGQWDDAKRKRWSEIATGVLGKDIAPHEATTRVLCDIVRAARSPDRAGLGKGSSLSLHCLDGWHEMCPGHCEPYFPGPCECGCHLQQNERA